MNLIKRWLLTLLAVCVVGVAHAADAKIEQHLLGSGDVIRISVYQNADLSLETRVSELGQINFPLIGTVKVGGLTLPGAEAQIAKQLRDGNFVLKPQVNVMLVQVRSSQISVLGQISKPGRYPIETVNSKLSEMIAAAGGVVSGGADVVTLIGTRDGKPIKMEVDLPAILQAGRVDLDVSVANGDILYVDRAPMFYIYGEVQRPGVVRLERGMTVLQALALSGGVTQRGTERGLRVHRRDASGAVQVLEPKMNDPVLRDDVIYVRESVF
jgi:polysaccharide export outer membrane protein